MADERRGPCFPPPGAAQDATPDGLSVVTGPIEPWTLQLVTLTEVEGVGVAERCNEELKAGKAPLDILHDVLARLRMATARGDARIAAGQFVATVMRLERHMQLIRQRDAEADTAITGAFADFVAAAKEVLSPRASEGEARQAKPYRPHVREKSKPAKHRTRKATTSTRRGKR
jgi:hypothetical protein